MAKTTEQFLREIIAEHVFQIAYLAAQVDKLNEENKTLMEKEGVNKNGDKQNV